MRLNKVSFSTRLYKRGAFSHFRIRDSEVSQSKKNFCGKMKLFTHSLDCDPLQYTQLECVKGPLVTHITLLFSAAINVKRCISKYAFRKWAVK